MAMDDPFDEEAFDEEAFEEFAEEPVEDAAPSE